MAWFIFFFPFDQLFISRADGVSGNLRFACADMYLYIVIDPAV